MGLAPAQGRAIMALAAVDSIADRAAGSAAVPSVAGAVEDLAAVVEEAAAARLAADSGAAVVAAADSVAAGNGTKEFFIAKLETAA